ncbi:hypothetical protein BgiBS90_031458, partial [Biomphalaria glabrata]
GSHPLILTDTLNISVDQITRHAEDIVDVSRSNPNVFLALVFHISVTSLFLCTLLQVESFRSVVREPLHNTTIHLPAGGFVNK